MSTKTPRLQIETDPRTGQLLSIHDRLLDMDVLRFAPGVEFRVNGNALATTATRVATDHGEHVAVLAAHDMPAYKAGRRFELTRYIVPGGQGLHTGRSNSLHIRYQLRRLPWTEWADGLDQVWGVPLEAPLMVETLSAPCGATDWFGAGTRMRAVAIGGSGPREHVSCEDGPVAQVVPWLATAFRTTFPGQQTFPGALYYDPSDGRFVLMLVRRPHVGGRIEFRTDGQTHHFAYFKALRVHDELTAPEISVFWGRGLQEAERVIATQFDLYEEPPAWWYNTAWFWLHPMWQPDSNFAAMGRAIEILMDDCGVTGFGLGVHDIPWSGRDIDLRSPRPAPCMGGTDNLKRACDLIRSKGGHSYVWMSRTGMYPAGDYRDAWSVRGEDGRRIMLDAVRLNICNCADPDYRAYLFRWVERYVRDIGVTGVFWDSGFQPMPPDFAAGRAQECPGEAMVAPTVFYDEVYRFGRSLSPDFFMWAEGISTECVSNAFAVDSRNHGGASGHRFMHRIAHAGARRLVWRSAWAHDLAGAFPFIDPASDICRDPGPAFYEKIAADPMNRWICRTVQERGMRHAIGLADGISLLDEFVVSCPGITGAVEIPAERARGAQLRHVISGQVVNGATTGGGLRVDLPASGAWTME